MSRFEASNLLFLSFLDDILTRDRRLAIHFFQTLRVIYIPFVNRFLFAQNVEPRVLLVVVRLIERNKMLDIVFSVSRKKFFVVDGNRKREIGSAAVSQPRLPSEISAANFTRGLNFILLELIIGVNTRPSSCSRYRKDR